MGFYLHLLLKFSPQLKLVCLVTDKVVCLPLKWATSQPNTGLHPRRGLVSFLLTRKPLLSYCTPGHCCSHRSSYLSMITPQPQVKASGPSPSVTAGKMGLASKCTNFNLLYCSASSGSWWWTGKPGVLQSMGLQRVRHDWATKLNLNWSATVWFNYLQL